MKPDLNNPVNCNPVNEAVWRVLVLLGELSLNWLGVDHVMAGTRAERARKDPLTDALTPLLPLLLLLFTAIVFLLHIHSGLSFREFDLDM